MEALAVGIGFVGILNVIALFLLARIFGELKDLRDCREKDRDQALAFGERMTALETEHDLFCRRNKSLMEANP